MGGVTVAVRRGGVEKKKKKIHIREHDVLREAVTGLERHDYD
jgi:hypothetical protein